MGKDRLFYLLQRYKDNHASREEVKELFGLLQSKEGEEALKKMIIREGLHTDQLLKVDGPLPSEEDWHSMQKKLMSLVRADRKPASVLSLLRMPRVAVSLLICAGLAITALVMARHKKTSPPVAERSRSADIHPGGNKAVLTLADGSTITLDSAHTGTLAQQGSVKVIKLNTGALFYNGKNAAEGEVLYNTIATPCGGQYQIVLPDGRDRKSVV